MSQSATRAEWNGHYLDGRTAARHPAAIRVMRSGLEVALEGGRRVWWPYAEICQTQGAYAGEQVRLERGPEPAEALLIADPAFLSALQQIAPEFAGRFHDPSRRRLRVGLTILAALAVIGLTTILYLWGIPGLARVVAARVPVEWEERLGEGIIAELALEGDWCAESPHAQVIEELARTVTAPLGDSPYTFRVLVVDRPIVNAFALPGGYIVLFRGLLAETPRAEVLAGVLAHEVQHVVQRHTTRVLLERASTGLLLAALIGDVSGALAYGLESARALGVLRYSRQHEEEADREGAALLVAGGIDPSGMIEFFESLQQTRGETPETLKYFLTHPRHEERIQRLKALVARSPRSSRPLLPEYDWHTLPEICPADAS